MQAVVTCIRDEHSNQNSHRLREPHLVNPLARVLHLECSWVLKTQTQKIRAMGLGRDQLRISLSYRYILSVNQEVLSSNVFFKDYLLLYVLLFMHRGVLFVCMCATIVCRSLEMRRGHTLELGLQAVVSHPECLIGTKKGVHLAMPG